MKIYFFGHGKVMENHCWKRVVTLATGSTTVSPCWVASPAMGHVPPSTYNNFILVHFGVNLRADYPSIMWFARSADADVNNSRLFRPVLRQSQNSSSRCCTRPWSPPWVPHDIITIFVPPRNNSWRCHWLCGPELNGVSYVLRCASLSSNSTGTSLPVTSP